ncbi:MAG: GspE/PulE family protein [Planctomycetaceae bacterium]
MMPASASASSRSTLPQLFSQAMASLPVASENYVPLLVDVLLNEARRHRASDIHLVPSSASLRMQWRIDGVLQTIAEFDGDLSPRVVARLKVLAGLLTYRTDVPQEGRISHADARADVDACETRVTTFPTLHGEKAAVRLFATTGEFQHLEQLGLPADIEATLRDLLQQTSGVVLLTGPSGSGKTTTVYACLRELVRLSGVTRSLMTLEDPIEVEVPGVTQSQVRPSAGFDLATGLKSMMRQDPDVIMVGEIRDPGTAESVFQAALTGHLVLTTFHAGSSVEAITRLLEMGIEPYLIRSSLKAVVCQRLLRRACPVCHFGDSEESADKISAAGHPSTGCQTCSGTRFHGRFVTGELLDPNVPEFARSVLEREDAKRLQLIAEESGMTTLRQRAEAAVRDRLTLPEEVFRVLGR